MAYLSFQNVSYKVQGRSILSGINLDLERGETLVLLGRSGSGKTTAMRLINRLLELSDGSIYLAGKSVKDVDPIELRRRIGYVIQEFGLLPHWTVEHNVSLVPQLLRWPKKRRGERAKELLDQVGLGHPDTGSRWPHELSGGQRQRVAVATALAAEPELLLFDEPFGALDPVTRHEMQQQFLRLRERYEVTSVFVTHDLLEAMTIGSKIAVLESGRLEAVTTPEQFLELETPTARAFRETLPAGLRPRH